MTRRRTRRHLLAAHLISRRAKITQLDALSYDPIIQHYDSDYGSGLPYLNVTDDLVYRMRGELGRFDQELGKRKAESEQGWELYLRSIARGGG